MAQETSREMDLKDCIQFTLEHATDVRKARLEVEKSQLEMKEQSARSLPQVDVNADLLYHFARPVDIAPGNLFDEAGRDIPIRFGKHIQTGLNLRVSQALFLPEFTIGEEGREKRVEVSRLQVQRSRENAALEVGRVYYQALSVNSRRGLLRANLHRIEGLLRLTQRQYENGFAKEIDVKQLTVAKKNLETKLYNLDLQYDRLLQVLKYRMSMPLETAIVLPDSLPEGPYQFPETAAETPSWEQRTEMALLRLRSDLQQLNAQRLKAGQLPRVYLQGALFLNGWGDTPAQWLDTDYWYGHSFLGLQVKYPLFTGFRRQAQISRAQVEIELAEEDRRHTEQSLKLQYDNAFQQLRVHYNELQSLEENRDLAREVYELTQKRYQEGVAPIMELLSTETGYREAQSNYLTALVEIKIAELELRHAKGELLYHFEANGNNQ